MMKVGDKVFYNDKIIECISVKEEWTSFPHGSGTTYEVYTFRGNDGKEIIYNTFDHGNNRMISIGYLEDKNSYLEKSIQRIQNEIQQNKQHIAQLKGAKL